MLDYLNIKAEKTLANKYPISTKIDKLNNFKMKILQISVTHIVQIYCESLTMALNNTSLNDSLKDTSSLTSSSQHH